MAFKIGDMVKRTSGSWRGVNEGDVLRVTSASGIFLSLEGYEGITFDGEKFELVQEVSPVAVPRDFKVGDRVRMISESPAHGQGEVSVGDVGVIVEVTEDRYKECIVDFPAQRGWNADFSDLEHEFPEVVQIDLELSLDEAVGNYQNVVQQIKELQAQAATYERLMRSHGLRPV